MLTSIIFTYLILINAAAFALMLADKRKAKARLWRVPEAVLLSAAAAGGGIGAFLGMHLLRHKTKHPQFSIGLPLIAAVQLWLIAILLK